MSSAPSSNPASPGVAETLPPKQHFDPEGYRMTVGEHLEELRRRLFYAAVGFFVAFVICMIYGEHVLHAFCHPLDIALERNHLTPQIYFSEAAEPFMTYIRISMISAATLAAPWIVYQVWQFIAAGLYPKERKYVTKYLPLSIVLLISGMMFLYFYVLPLMLQFFIAFNIGSVFPMKNPLVAPGTAATTQAFVHVPIIGGDPPHPVPGDVWMNGTLGLLKICIRDGESRVITLGTESLLTPLITLGPYIDTVVEMLLAFGLSFQLPLIVLALNKIGILSVEALKGWRRVVYFSLTVISAFIVPDVATGMVALLVPLILLYELGILLAKWSGEKAEAEDPQHPTHH